MHKLKFGSFEFSNNPSKLQISCENEIKELQRPYGGAVTQNYGSLGRTVIGEGVFTGADAFLEFIRFKGFWGKGEALLSVPGFEPFYAYLRKLQYIGAPGDELIRYSFELRECTSVKYASPSAPPYHTAQGGQSVFDIALLYGISPERIILKNPALNSLVFTGGETVSL